MHIVKTGLLALSLAGNKQKQPHKRNNTAEKQPCSGNFIQITGKTSVTVSFLSETVNLTSKPAKTKP